MWALVSQCIQRAHKDLARPNFRLWKRKLSLWAVGLLRCMTERAQVLHMIWPRARVQNLRSQQYDGAEPWLHPYVITPALISCQNQEVGVRSGRGGAGHSCITWQNFSMQPRLPWYLGCESTSPTKLPLRFLPYIGLIVLNSQLELVSMAFFRGYPMRNQSWIS